LQRDYNRAVVSAIESKDEEKLNFVIKSLEIAGSSLTETEVAICWHLSHLENRGLASFAIHININVLLKLLGCNLDIPNLRIISGDDKEIKDSSILQSHVNLCLRKLFAA